MMNINDPRLEKMLESAGTYKTNSKPIEKVFELPVISSKVCIHKINFDQCPTCQCIEAGATSDHEISSAVYIRLAPLPKYPGNYDQKFTAQQRKIHFEQKIKHAGFILQRKQASEYDTLIWISQQFNEDFRTDQEFLIMKYLFAKFYDFEKIFGKEEKPKMQKVDIDLLAGIRKHVFECQMRTIKRAMEYNRGIDEND